MQRVLRWTCRTVLERLIVRLVRLEVPFLTRRHSPFAPWTHRVLGPARSWGGGVGLSSPHREFIRQKDPFFCHLKATPWAQLAKRNRQFWALCRCAGLWRSDKQLADTRKFSKLFTVVHVISSLSMLLFKDHQILPKHPVTSHSGARSTQVYNPRNIQPFKYSVKSFI